MPGSNPGPDALRRRVTLAALPALLLPTRSRAQASSPAATDCRPRAPRTLAQTEGPFYSPDTPKRESLLDPAIPGTRVVLSGLVLTPDCRAIAGAMLDFWQADEKGNYDNRGYRLRGHQFTDDRGRWRLETVLPGLYTGRTRHIHVKIRARDGRSLTTQLYFPDEAGNSRDSIFRRELLVRRAGDEARFDFVIDT